MASKFMRETTAEMFSLLYVGLVGILFVIGGWLVDEVILSAFGLGLTTCLAVQAIAKIVIEWAYKRYDPDPIEGHRKEE